MEFGDYPLGHSMNDAKRGTERLQEIKGKVLAVATSFFTLSEGAAGAAAGMTPDPKFNTELVIVLPPA